MANKKRLIDANALMGKLFRMIDYCIKDPKVNGRTALTQVGDAIMDCPTVDAEEVVRCKECFAWKEYVLERCLVGKGYCKVNKMDTDGYFYCGYAVGERKEK